MAEKIVLVKLHLYSKHISKGIVIILTLALVYYFGFELPFRGTLFNQKRHGRPPLTPPWALECWLWEDDYNSGVYIDSLLAGYRKYDIPVRTILLDSPWSLRYNDFEPDTLLYPNPETWFKKLQSDGYRVVLWMTSMVNSWSKDTRFAHSEDWFNLANENGYFAGNGFQTKWWKGKGGFIDYSNPEAMLWWRGLQQKIFDYGIDGWKLDGTATLFHSKIGPVPLPFNKTHQGIMTTREYMDHYYRDEYQYGLTKNPEFVTLVRAIDRGFHPEGFAPIDAAPVTWVGDQKHTWESVNYFAEENEPDSDIAMDGIDGIEMAMSNIIKSAKLGYNIIGSDIAGFSGNKIPPRLYIRWAQFSTFCGLFLNGGHGERMLWKRSKQELEIIRKFSWLHTELIPYMYSYVVSAHYGGRVLQKPVKGKYHYLFGDNFLVAPIFRDDLKNKVTLPSGKWRYFFDDKKVITGPVTYEREFPLDEYPVYIKEGAIVPLKIERNYTGLGDEKLKGFITWLIYPGTESKFTLFHPDKSGSTDVKVSSEKGNLIIRFEGIYKPSILKIHLNKMPFAVQFDNKLLIDSVDYQYDEVNEKLNVKLPSNKNGIVLIKT